MAWGWLGVALGGVGRLGVVWGGMGWFGVASGGFGVAWWFGVARGWLVGVLEWLMVVWGDLLRLGVGWLGTGGQRLGTERELKEWIEKVYEIMSEGRRPYLLGRPCMSEGRRLGG